MQKVFINIITQVVIATILVTLFIFSSNISSHHNDSERSSPLLVHDVYIVCNDSINGNDPEYKELARSLCDFYLRAIKESFYYHRSFTEYFKREDDDEANHIVELADIYNPFGCDIIDLNNNAFINLIISYSDNNPDDLEDSFYFSLRKITEPYCVERINKMTEYYLDEYDGRRKS